MERLLFHIYVIYNYGNTSLNKTRCFKQRLIKVMLNIKAMFYIYLRTNSDLCHLQHKLIGFYNRDEKCLRTGSLNKAVCASSLKG